MDPSEVLITIAKNIANLFPARIIQKNEQGIRWTLGKPSKILYSGRIHFFWPGIGHIDKVDITDGTIDIDTLTIDLKDETITLDGAILYAIVDARKYLLNLEEDDSGPTLSLIARGCVSDVVRKYGTLEERIYPEIVDKFNYETEQYGVLGKQFIPGNYTKSPLNIRLLG